MKNPQLPPARFSDIPEYWNMGLHFLERPERINAFDSVDTAPAFIIRILMDEIQHLRERVYVLESIQK